MPTPDKKTAKEGGGIRSRGGRLLQTSIEVDPLAPSAAVRAAVATRLETAIWDLINASSQATLLGALEKRTGIDTLIDLVSQNSAALNAAAQTPDPLRAARSRAAQRMADLIKAEGGPIGVDEVAERLGIGRAAVDKRRKKGSLIGIQDGARAVRYPSWQFTASGILPGLSEALEVIGVDDPWMRLQFFLSPDSDMRATPLEALRSGRSEEVASAAARYGRQGADA